MQTSRAEPVAHQIVSRPEGPVSKRREQLLTSPAFRQELRQQWTHRGVRSPGWTEKEAMWELEHEKPTLKIKSAKRTSTRRKEKSADIFMLHVLEQSELPVGPLSKDLRLEGPVELLNGHFLFGLLIYCWAVEDNGITSIQHCTLRLWPPRGLYTIYPLWSRSGGRMTPWRLAETFFFIHGVEK